jgi:hypothetical protein
MTLYGNYILLSLSIFIFYLTILTPVSLSDILLIIFKKTWAGRVAQVVEDLPKQV